MAQSAGGCGALLVGWCPAVRCGAGALFRRCGFGWWFVVVRAEGGYCVIDGLFPLFPSGRVGAEGFAPASG